MAKTILSTGQYSQVSLYELEVFLEVSKTQSIRETARRFKVEAGQISRLIKRLETKVGFRLVDRTPTGITLTRRGSTMVKIGQEINDRGDEIAALSREGQFEKSQVYGIGSASFLSSHLLAEIVGSYTAENPGQYLRILDVAPDQIISLGLKGAYDLSLHAGNLDWPRSWQTQQLGALRWQLFARKGLNLPQRCNVQSIKTYAFVAPVYWTNEGLIEGNDQCPLPLRQRNLGVSTSTAEAALGVLKSSDHLAFLPEILARGSVRNGEVRAIEVKEWKEVSKPLVLAVRSDSVPQKLFTSLADKLRAALLN